MCIWDCAADCIFFTSMAFCPQTTIGRSVAMGSLHGPTFAVCCQYLGVSKHPNIWETQYQEAEEESSYTGWKGAAELLSKSGSVPEDENRCDSAFI